MTSKGYEQAKSGDITGFKETMSKRWISLKHWTNEALGTLFKKNVAAELNNQSKIGTPKSSQLTRQTNIKKTE